MPPRRALEPDDHMWDWVAFELRWERLRRNLSGAEVADLLRVDRSTVSRLETGRQRLNTDYAALLDADWKTGGKYVRLVRYALRAHDIGWFDQYTRFESQAIRILMYDGQLIPWLFQTPEYARALLLVGRPKDLDAAVADRMKRQEILSRADTPDIWALIAETTLQCLVGGPAVMRAQLAMLLEVCELPNVTLRVVPNSAGANRGLDGPFRVITAPDGDIGFVEAPTGGRLVSDGPQVRDLALRFHGIGAQALPIDSSRDLIKQLMETLK